MKINGYEIKRNGLSITLEKDKLKAKVRLDGDNVFFTNDKDAISIPLELVKTVSTYLNLLGIDTNAVIDFK